MIAPNLAHFAAWLVGANDDHPLLIERIDYDVLAPLEAVLGDLERAQPLRLAQKRRSFQALKSFDVLIEMRAELLTAALLTRIGSHVDFGADHPDLLLGDDCGGIEVGTRRLDGPRRLFERLDGPRRLFERLDEVARQTDQPGWRSYWGLLTTFPGPVVPVPSGQAYVKGVSAEDNGSTRLGGRNLMFRQRGDGQSRRE